MMQFILLSVFLICSGCASMFEKSAAKSLQYDFIMVTNVNIIDVENGLNTEKQTVLIKNNKIKKIMDASDIEQPANTLLIDGNGLYLMPGLFDMHVHISGKNELPLFIYNGVTTVRNMWGTGNMAKLFGIPNQLELKKEIADGTLPGPEIFTAGTPLDNDSFVMTSIKTRSDAEKLVLDHKKNGYDFIKVYDYLSYDNYKDILEFANKNQIPVYGHVPKSVNINQAITLGQKSIEHITGFLDYDKVELLVPESDIPAIAKLMKEKKVCVCPTIIMANNRKFMFDEAFYGKNHQSFMTKFMDFFSLMPIKIEVFSKYNNKDGIPYNIAAANLMKKTVKVLKDNGVSIVAGSDSGNPNVLAGFSLIDELFLLKEAGLSNLEVLQSATIEAAKCMGISDRKGKVKENFDADLILLKNNPLTDIENIKSIKGVFVRGKWYAMDDDRDLK
ncbi:MAG: hypothetical protein C0403_08060 [Desulfobacterium sp.]|nr:hypothetical protein [Desulfobacterium sp.]